MTPLAPVLASGRWAAARLRGAAATLLLVGELVIALQDAIRGRLAARRADFLIALWEAGPSALLIVGVVNLLIGAILAFIAAVQLVQFGASIYVANLVGIAVCGRWRR